MDIYHDSHHIFFRQPFGAAPCGEKVTLRLAIRTHVPVRAWIRLWKEDHEERLPMQPVEDEAMGNHVIFEGSFPVPEHPGLLWYYFVVEESMEAQKRLMQTKRNTVGTSGTDKTTSVAPAVAPNASLGEDDWDSLSGVIHYYGNNPRRLGGIGALARSAYCRSFGSRTYMEEPPSYQITVSSRDNHTPEWYKQGIMYQIFVDRFHQGGGPRWKHALPGRKALFHQDWHDKPFYIRNEWGGIDRWLFFGGNLDGVRCKLDYLRSLGVTILYLNPIFEAASNHKYDTGDYHKLDPLFGDEEILQTLVEEARERGISIILDGVFSHTGADSRYFNRKGLYPELGAYQSEQSPYKSWYCFEEYPDSYSSWWGISDLPNVNEMEPSYIDFICRGQESVIRTWMRKGIRGWRLDVADELPDDFIRSIRAAMREEDSESVLIGEVWEDASHKVSYGTMRKYFAGDELHGTMNYPFRAFLLDFMVYHISAYDLCAGLMSLYENYPRENFYGAMNLLGSHDVNRILTMLGDPPADDIMSEGEKRDYCMPTGSREVAVKRLNMMVLWQMAFPGVPCIYYGDEAGMEGFRDPYNRGPYPWGREDQTVLNIYRRWTALRREYALLRDGEMCPVWAGDMCGFWRFWPDERENGDDSGDAAAVTAHKERILVLVNRSDAVLRYVVGGTAHSGDELWSQPCWARPLTWGGFEQSEVIDLDGGKRERPGNLEESSYCVEVPALSTRILMFRPVEDLPKPAWLDSAAGVLLPVASLPSSYGIGDFGPSAYEFVDVLVNAGQKVWQILPLNPLDQVNSPYQSSGAMGISILYISPHKLVEYIGSCFPEVAAELVRADRSVDYPDGVNNFDRVSDCSDVDKGYLDVKGHIDVKKYIDIAKGDPDLSASSHFESSRFEGSRIESSRIEGSRIESSRIEGSRIDYVKAASFKENLMRRTFALLTGARREPGTPGEDFWQEFEEFRRQNAFWLEDYALFWGLKAENHGCAWSQWEDSSLGTRDADALVAARQRLQDEIESIIFEQFIANKQFLELRAYANGRGLLIMGDLPLYVAADSADCWAHQPMFWLKEGQPMAVAGVPPDDFAEDGQRWGNPLYRWDVMAQEGYSWWCARLKRAFDLFDFVRLDHFRGFAAYWEIPADQETAREGQWMKGPGRDFFKRMQRQLGSRAQAIVAEDLGYYTPEVKILREMLGIPGMKVLQFEDTDGDVAEDTVFFSGTHDNDTLWGWVTDKETSQLVKQHDRVTGHEGHTDEVCRGLLEGLYTSRAGLVVLPVQDILLLDSHARTNVPGTSGGNWEWKMGRDDLTDPAWAWLKEMAQRSGRHAKTVE